MKYFKNLNVHGNNNIILHLKYVLKIILFNLNLTNEINVI